MLTCHNDFVLSTTHTIIGIGDTVGIAKALLTLNVGASEHVRRERETNDYGRKNDGSN